jgi:hypothetical protein
MAHGEKDYTQTTAAKVVSAKIDFDLPVIFIERFDSANFHWATVGIPIDIDAQMEEGAAYEGDAGLALRSSLAAAGAGEFVIAYRHAFTTLTQKLAFSSLFRINQDRAFMRSIEFGIYGRYNAAQFQTAIRYRPVNSAWDYMDATTAWIEFLTGIQQDTNAWNRMYVEIDLANAQYIAFETADQRISLRPTPIWTNPVPGNEELVIQIITINQVAGTRADLSIDDIIIKELGS